MDLNEQPAVHSAKTVKLNHEVLYEMTVRNQFFVPAKKCPFVTVDYLLNVKAKNVFCPRYRDIRTRPCPTPPRKECLVKAVADIAEKKQLNFGLMEGGPHPNTSWLLSIIATYQPEHIFFSKSYRPQHHKKDRVLDNTDNFFDNLPPALTQSKKVKRSNIIKKLLMPEDSDENEEQKAPMTPPRQRTSNKSSTLTPNMKELSMGGGTKKNPKRSLAEFHKTLDSQDLQRQSEQLNQTD